MRINRPAAVAITAAASVAIVATCILACTEGEIDLDKYKDIKANYSFVDTPTEMEMLVGEQLDLRVRVKNAKGERITAESGDYEIVSVHEKNDSVIVFKAVSEGQATVRLSCAGNTHDVNVTVKEIYLNSLDVSTTSLDLDMGEDEAYVYLTVDPSDYPVHHLTKEISDSSKFSVVVSRDSAKNRNYARVLTRNVGKSDFSLSGRHSDGSQVSKTVSVTVNPVPVRSIKAFVVADSVQVGWDTLTYVVSRNPPKVGKKLVPKYKYTYYEMTESCRKLGKKDTITVVMSWDPESATVRDSKLTIAYANEKTSIKWDKSSGSGVNVDSLYAKIQDGSIESGADYDKVFGTSGVDGDKATEYCSAERDMNSKHGFYTYTIIPKKKGTVVMKEVTKYCCDLEDHRKTISKKFMFEIQDKDHVDPWWKD